MSDVQQELRTARNWYRWLWLSPILTLPTLAYGINSLDLPIIMALLLSALWHLVLLIPSLTKQSDFIRWHGRQALMLAVIRTAVPICLVILLGHVDSLTWSILILLVVWLFGTLWGQNQAGRGECSLANWFGREISLALPELGVILEEDEDPDTLVEIVRFSRAPQTRRTALLKLEKFGMVEGLDQISVPIHGGPPAESEVLFPAVKKDRSYVWFILLGVVIVIIFGLNTVNRRQVARSVTATAQARATGTAVAASVIQTLEAFYPRASAYPIILYDTFDADEDVWQVGERDSELLTGTRMIDGSTYRWEATAKNDFYWWSTPELEQPPIEFFLSVDAKLESGPPSSYFGVVFRMRDSDNFYAFLISENQRIKVTQQRDDRWRTIKNFDHLAIIPGIANRLSVVSAGCYFSLFVNDQPVYSFVDCRFDYGEAGLIVSADAGDHAILSFDNFELRKLPLTAESADEKRSYAISLVKIGEKRAREGDIENALALFKQAQDTDPDMEISPRDWNTLCWYGSLWGFASQVMFACENAVAPDPTQGNRRDSRGLARALTGDYTGAIEDFQYYVDWASGGGRDAELVQKRKDWIRDLEAGINPFNPQTLEALKDE